MKEGETHSALRETLWTERGAPLPAKRPNERADSRCDLRGVYECRRNKFGTSHDAGDREIPNVEVGLNLIRGLHPRELSGDAIGRGREMGAAGEPSTLELQTSSRRGVEAEEKFVGMLVFGVDVTLDALANIIRGFARGPTD